MNGFRPFDFFVWVQAYRYCVTLRPCSLHAGPRTCMHLVHRQRQGGRLLLALPLLLRVVLLLVVRPQGHPRCPVPPVVRPHVVQQQQPAGAALRLRTRMAAGISIRRSL